MKTVLLVEDNAGDIGLVREAFAECGIAASIQVAENAVQAFDFLGKKGAFSGQPTPDLVLLDLNLPIIGGLQVLEVMRVRPEWREIPVVVLTNSKLPAEHAACSRLGAIATIVKPKVWQGYCELFSSLKRSIESGVYEGYGT